jgi:hypothetical protein
MRAFQTSVHKFMSTTNKQTFQTKETCQTEATAATNTAYEEPVPVFLKAMTATQDIKASCVEDTLQDLFASGEGDSFMAKKAEETNDCLVESFCEQSSRDMSFGKHTQREGSSSKYKHEQ